MALERYKLVPEDEIEGAESNELDYLGLLLEVWEHKLFIFKMVLAASVIGIIISYLLPVEYQSDAKFIPETNNSQSGASGLVQRYGDMLGLSGGLASGDGNVMLPNLYPQIVYSLSFQKKLLDAPIQFQEPDTTVSVYTYFSDMRTPPLSASLKKYTIGLPFTIRDYIRGEDEQGRTTRNFEGEVVSVSEKELAVIEQMKSRIGVSFDQESGIISVTTRMPDALATATFGQKVVAQLKEQITQHKVEKQRQNLEFIKKQYAEAKTRYVKAQKELATFRDQNVSLATSTAQTELERLQDQKNLTYNLYNSLAQQLEKAKITLQENRPIFSNIDPFEVPLKKSSPNRLLVLIMFAFLGGLISVIWIFKDDMFEYWNTIISKRQAV